MRSDGSNQPSPIHRQAMESRTRQKWLQPSEDNMMWMSSQQQDTKPKRETQGTRRLSPLLDAQRDYYGKENSDELSASRALAAVKSRAVVGVEEWEDSRRPSRKPVSHQLTVLFVQ